MDVPKTKWKMAVVEQLIKVIDGYVRAATIGYNGGRTISKLYPLEVPSVETVEVSSIEAFDQNTIDDDHDKGSDVTHQVSNKSARSSAIKAQQNIANWTLAHPGGCQKLMLTYCI